MPQTRPYALAFIILSLIFQSLSTILGKYASLTLGGFSLAHVLKNPYYLASLACLALQAITWPLALRHFPLFWAYLCMSGVYLIIPLASYFLFHEALTAANVVGGLFIMAGIAIMSLSAARATPPVEREITPHIVP